jgi:hypothetical protein
MSAFVSAEAYITSADRLRPRYRGGETRRSYLKLNPGRSLVDHLETGGVLILP